MLAGDHRNTKSLMKPVNSHGASMALGLLFSMLLICYPGWSLAAEKPSAYAVASAHPLATQAGMDILKAGGNAFDAAISVAAVLAVVEPYGSGMGGGGFWLLKGIPKGKSSLTARDESQVVMVDARETAPKKAKPDLYVNTQGEVDRDLAINTPLSAGIPGQAAAMAHIAEHYGSLPLTQLLAAAIHYAEQGFSVDEKYRKLMQYRIEIIQRYPHSSSIFLDQGRIPEIGHLVVQKDLGATLRKIAAQGHDGFYKGAIARKLLASVQKNGGIWAVSDLAHYQVVERKPIKGTFLNQEIISAPPPSAGGIALMQILKQLESLGDPKSFKAAQQIHLNVEAMRRAYYDRGLYLGDPDFVSIPAKQLLSAIHIKSLTRTISMEKATDSKTFKQIPLPTQGTNTTHFSVLDREGKAASVTLSINLPFGSGFVAQGTGVLLNNEMDDFSSAPGTPNAYGLIGLSANRIEPGKRPLSSMTPTFVLSEKQVGILGTPGGSRIITMVALGVQSLARLEPVNQWVSLPRYHHQFSPDVIQHEPGAFSEKIVAALTEKGHKLKQINRQYGNMHAINWDLQQNQVTAASDPRGVGLSMVCQTTAIKPDNKAN